MPPKKIFLLFLWLLLLIGTPPALHSMMEERKKEQKDVDLKENQKGYQKEQEAVIRSELYSPNASTTGFLKKDDSSALNNNETNVEKVADDKNVVPEEESSDMHAPLTLESLWGIADTSDEKIPPNRLITDIDPVNKRYFWTSKELIRDSKTIKQNKKFMETFLAILQEHYSEPSIKSVLSQALYQRNYKGEKAWEKFMEGKFFLTKQFIKEVLEQLQEPPVENFSPTEYGRVHGLQQPPSFLPFPSWFYPLPVPPGFSGALLGNYYPPPNHGGYVSRPTQMEALSQGPNGYSHSLPPPLSQKKELNPGAKPFLPSSSSDPAEKNSPYHSQSSSASSKKSNSRDHLFPLSIEVSSKIHPEAEELTETTRSGASSIQSGDLNVKKEEVLHNAAVPIDVSIIKRIKENNLSKELNEYFVQQERQKKEKREQLTTLAIEEVQEIILDQNNSKKETALAEKRENAPQNREHTENVIGPNHQESSSLTSVSSKKEVEGPIITNSETHTSKEVETDLPPLEDTSTFSNNKKKKLIEKLEQRDYQKKQALKKEGKVVREYVEALIKATEEDKTAQQDEIMKLLEPYTEYIRPIVSLHHQGKYYREHPREALSKVQMPLEFLIGNIWTAKVLNKILIDPKGESIMAQALTHLGVNGFIYLFNHEVINDYIANHPAFTRTTDFYNDYAKPTMNSVGRASRHILDNDPYRALIASFGVYLFSASLFGYHPVTYGLFGVTIVCVNNVLRKCLL